MNKILAAISPSKGRFFLKKTRAVEVSQQLHTILDIAFITGLVFSLFLGSKVTPALIIAGAIPIPFLLRELRKNNNTVPKSRLVFPFAAYFAYNIGAYVFFTGLATGDIRPINPSYEFYIIAIVMVVLGAVRGLQTRDLSKLFRYAVPAALFVSFIVLTVLMFSEAENQCRVRGAAPWPFIPALLFTTLTLLSYVGWNTLSKFEKRARVVLLACSIVVVNAYTASRGVAVGQFAAIAALLLLGMLGRFSGSLPNWRNIIVAVAGGVGMSAIIGMATGCGPMTRIQPVIDSAIILLQHAPAPIANADLPPATAQQDIPAAATAPSAIHPEAVEKIGDTDQSISLRLAMWDASVAAIKEKPVFGHGALYLQKLITERFGFEHNHNQYLSWLVTGGLVGLIIGLGFLATPWLISVGLGVPDRMIILIAVSLLWGVAMMFDSFFNLKFYTHYYSFLCGVLYAWTCDLRRKRELM